MNVETSSKRDRNRMERRAAIVALARQAFLEDGYGATTMSSVAEAMGGSKATLWAHFSSKEELFAAVVESMVDTFAQRIDTLLRSSPCTRNNLRTFCLRFLERLLDPDSIRLHRLLMAEGARFPHLGAQLHAQGPQRIVPRLEGWLATALPAPRAGCLAQTLCHALVGYRNNQMLVSAFGMAPARAYVDDLLQSLNLEPLA